MIDIHYINYYYIFDHNMSDSSFIAPKEFNNPQILELGFYPHSFEHLVYGVQYYEDILLLSKVSRYNVDFIYSTNNIDYEDFKRTYYNVFFIFAHNTDFMYTFFKGLKENNLSNYICVNYTDIYCENNDKFFSSKNEAICYLKKIAKHFVSDDPKKEMYYLCEWDSSIKNDYTFDASYINTLVSHSIMGNFEFNKTLIYDTNGDINGQDIILEQLNVLNSFEEFAFEKIHNMFPWDYPLIYNQKERLKKYVANNMSPEDINRIVVQSFSLPIIVAMPYTSDYVIKKIVPDYKIKKILDIKQRTFLKVLKHKSSIDYKCPHTDEKVKKEYNELFIPRTIFNDFIGLINTSYRFSQYIRLPFVGNENNCYITDKVKDNSMLLRKILNGEEIINIDNLFSANLKTYFANTHKQIVAISDYPIEWITIDGVPLCFTNDITHIMDIPYTKAITQNISINKLCIKNYTIPKDILAHTLVVFGTDYTIEDETTNGRFFFFQNNITDLHLKCTTVRCKNKEELFLEIKKYAPQLLIIDGHGGYDEDKDETYIYFGEGNEEINKLNSMDVVNNLSNIPLVYLSCCSLNPLSKNFDAISNAFIVAGSISVTSSILPVDVDDASIAYIRLLNMLTNIDKMPFSNWLAFVSYINRTTFCNEIIDRLLPKSYEKDIKDKTKRNITRIDIQCNAKIYEKYAQRVLFYENRREVFKDMKDIFEQRKNFSKDNLFPHFFRTINIGRGDLAFFE